VSDAPSAALSGLRVLVIEDEFLIALDLRSILDDLGCVALGPAATVPEALRLLVTDPPDATLLDLNLGGASAAPVAEALTTGGMPFVIVTAYWGWRGRDGVRAGGPSGGRRHSPARRPSRRPNCRCTAP
jgi:CheY-like chemotaxis protein